MSEKSESSKKCAVVCACIFLIVFCLFSNTAFANTQNVEKVFDYPVKNAKVVKGYIEPISKYGPGHRGVDFYATPGTKVFAAADGQVVFAGLVAGSLHVTIAHSNHIKSTYTFLATKSVKAGDTVARGQTIGTVGEAKPPREANTFLFTMRINNSYVDPMLYLNKKTQPREIRLSKLDNRDGLLEEKSKKEKIEILDLIKSQNPFEQLLKFQEGFNKKSSKALERFVNKSVSSYEKSKDLFKEIKELLVKISVYQANSSAELLKSSMKKLKKLEKELIKDLKQAFDDFFELSEELAKYYEQALESGIDAGKWYLRQTADIIAFLIEMPVNLVLFVNDLVSSVSTATLKQLNQFAEIDLPALLRAVVLPGSCMLSTCSQAIQLKCDPTSSFNVRNPSSNYKGSGNSVLVVGGLGTEADLDQNGKLKSSVDVPTGLLGYSPDDTNYFSYSGKNRNYKTEDTFQDVNVLAKNFDDQVKDFHLKSPVKKLDLISHSLGGAVVGLWLAKYYDESNPSYPKIGKVIMLGTPTAGTSLANGRKFLESNDDGQTIMDAIASVSPRAGSDSVGALEEDGEIDNAIEQAHALTKVDVSTIRLSRDWVVPAATNPQEGENEIVLASDPNKISYVSDSHNKMLTNSKVVSTMQHVLEGSKPPCQSIGNSIQAIGDSAVLRSSELFIGRSASDYADATSISDVSSFLESFAG